MSRSNINSAAINWFDRAELSTPAGKSALNAGSAQATGHMLFADEPGESFLPVAVEDIPAMVSLSAVTLGKLGLNHQSRVLMALNQQGGPGASLLAQAAAHCGADVALVNPRGRMRLLSTIRSMRPNLLVMTPCGAMDLLARLYIEFNVDPEELGIERIVLVGEVVSDGAARRLANEFYAKVSHLYCDPFFGLALACRVGDEWQEGEPGILHKASLTRDELSIDELFDCQSARSELVLTPNWSSAMRDCILRTGQIIDGDHESLFKHTVGEHLLIKGRWVSLPELRRRLKLIDGVSRWTLIIDRGEGTLDAATLKVGLNRESLLANPMWQKRLEDAVISACPVAISVETELYEVESSGVVSERIDDKRGQHLGIQRSE